MIEFHAGVTENGIRTPVVFMAISIGSAAARRARSKTTASGSAEEMNFSARAHDRFLKVARTLAVLAGASNIRPSDVLEAIQYRSLDRRLFS